MSPVFVFERENTGEFRVVDDMQYITLDHRWKLIATLDPTTYIQNLLMKYPALVMGLKGGSV